MDSSPRPIGLSRKDFLKAVAAVSLGSVLAACGGAASGGSVGPSGSGAGSAQAGPQGWDDIVKAARAEGSVNVYGGQGEEKRLALIDPFQKAYPGIKISGTFAPGRDLTVRIASERQAGKNIADVLMGPGASAIFPLKPIGALAPLAPALMLPEVTDTSLWLNNHLGWLDASEPYTTLAFVANVQSQVAYNTKMVDPKEITSYKDLLNPKWKGKIVSTDVRKAGAGAVGTRFIYKNPALGPDYLQHLFADMQPTLSNDNRQMTDWIAQGRYPIGLFQNPPDVLRTIEEGLPVAMLPGELKEGGTVGPSAGTVSIVDKAPHPNAAKVFVNWLLSKDGQLAWQKYVKDNSARTDISKDGVPSLFLPRPNFTYTNAATEDYAKLSDTVIPELITKAVGSN